MKPYQFKRPSGTKPYRKVFYVLSEGEKTEPLYFGMLKKNCENISIHIIGSDKKTNPEKILRKAKKLIAKKKKDDYVWIVIDVDENKESQLKILFEWTKSDHHYGLALSNPKFEYWLLLHFDEGNNVTSGKICDERLQRYLPEYRKNYLDERQLYPKIKYAIDNARKKHKQCEEWFSDAHTTVYELVESILKAENDALNKS